MATRNFKYATSPIMDSGSPMDFNGTSLGIYSVETTQRYVCGARHTTWDGREFVYCKSAAALVTHLGCQFTSAGVISITNAVTTAAIGDSKVVVPTATHSALAEDELAGGFIFIYYNGPVQTRGIIGNDVSASAAAITVYLEAPLAVAVTATTSKFEIFHNPYKYMTQTGGDPNAFGWIGPPAAAVSASGYYFWAQRKGPVNMAPQSTITESNEAVGLAFRGDGSLEAVGTAFTAVIPTNDTSQYAGFRMGGSYTNNGPLIYLTG